MGGRAGGGGRGGYGGTGGKVEPWNLYKGLGTDTRTQAGKKAVFTKNMKKYGPGKGMFKTMPAMQAKYNLSVESWGGSKGVTSRYSVAFRNPFGVVQTQHFTNKSSANKFLQEWTAGGVLAKGKKF